MTLDDKILATKFSNIIKEDLGITTLNKIEKKLDEKFGLTLESSIHDFKKLDSILRELLTDEPANMIESKLLSYTMIDENSHNNWMKIKDTDMIHMISKITHDQDIENILRSIFYKPLTPNDILLEMKILHSSGYRKINELLEFGLIAIHSFKVNHGRRIPKYICVFSDIRIDLKENAIYVKKQSSKIYNKKYTLKH